MISAANRRRKMEEEGLKFLQARVEDFFFFLQSHNITVFLIFQNTVGFWKVYWSRHYYRKPLKL